MSYICAMEYCLAVVNEILIHATTWINLKTLCQVKKKCHTQKALHFLQFHLCEISRKGKSLEIESK